MLLYELDVCQVADIFRKKPNIFAVVRVQPNTKTFKNLNGVNKSPSQHVRQRHVVNLNEVSSLRRIKQLEKELEVWERCVASLEEAF